MVIGMAACCLTLCHAHDASATCIADTIRSHQLDSVEVKGSTPSQRILRSTSPLQRLSRQDLLRLGVTDMADALHRIPGINLRDYGGAGGMKTVSVRGLGAQHTGVAYDGVLLSECQGGEIDVSRYSLEHVQSITLTVGDNDDIFVSARQAAVPACVSIETMGEVPADRGLHLTAQVKAGSFGYVAPFVRMVRRMSDGLTLSALGEYIYAENDYPFVLRNGRYSSKERRSNSRMRSGHAELGAHWQLGRRNQLWGKVYYYDNDRQLPGIVRYYNNLSAEQLHDRNFFSQARWLMRSQNDKWMLKVHAKYSWASSAYTDSLVAQRLNDASYWQREWYASAALMWLTDEHWTLDYSADYAYHTLNSSLNTDNRPRQHSVLQSATAKWSQGRWMAVARILASLYFNGARWGDKASDAHRLSPSLSLSYHLLGHPVGNADVYLRASYKDIFRVPTFNESYFFHYGSTDLQPESTRQCNLGATWQQRWLANLSTMMTVDGYLNRVSDKIVGVPYNMFVWRMVNLGKVDVRGVDVSVKAEQKLLSHAKMPHRLTLAASYSYQQVLNHTDRTSENYGKQVAYTPEHSGSVAIGWENPWVNVACHGTGMSMRWANNNHYEDSDIAGYWEMGLSAYRSFRLGRGWVDVRVDIKNLLDKQYELVASYPMPGRSWQASVGVRF